MAKMLPFPIDSFTTPSEERMYELFRNQLSDEYTVFYGRSWKFGQEDKEADFIITKPGGGIIVIEVKGGLWERRDGTWLAYGNPQTGPDDPFTQVRSIKGSLVELLRSQQGWRDVFYPITTAVALPDTDYRKGTDLTGLPKVILYADLKYLAEIVEDLMNECLHSIHPFTPDRRILEHLTNTLMRDYVIRLNEVLAMDEERLVTFTEEQLKLDRSLRRMRRLTTQGCAGSGKTLLALRQVRQLASRPEVKRILLTCFNRELGTWLAAQTRDLDQKCLTMPIMEFFANVALAEGVVNEIDDKDPEYYQNLPFWFLEGNTTAQYRFDAIVVDEGQSFRREWWDVLESLLVDKENSYFYIFYDGLQRIYQEMDNPVPGEDQPFELTINLRNTAKIHQHSTKFLPKDQLPDSNMVEGEHVWVHTYADKDSQVKALRKVLRMLITEGGVSIKDIVLLTTKNSRSIFQPEMKIGNYVISKVESTNPQALRMATIQAYRGMERKVVILAEMDQDVENLTTLNYLGASRARTKLVLLVSNALDEETRSALIKSCKNITDEP